MELERSLDDFKAEGLGVVAISYDRPEVLRHFEDRAGGFSYPLLSDPRSQIITAFGILNTNVPEDDPYHGIPFPGTYIVDEDGIVRSKYFETSHRQRFTAKTILVKEFGSDGAAGVEVQTDAFLLAAYPSQSVVRRGSRFTFVLEFELPSRMHLYALGVEGYRPLVLRFEDQPFLKIHETSYPEPETLYLPAIDETVPVFFDSLRIEKDVTLSPRFEGWNDPDRRETTLELQATLDYQACDDTVCYTPQSLPLRFRLDVAAHDLVRVPAELRWESKDP